MRFKISKEMLKLVVGSSQKDKILGLSGWLINFCLGFYDFMEKDRLKVVEESRLLG